MRTFVAVPPLDEPITLNEAKEQLRIEPGFTLDDDYIGALISSARERCESYCNQFFTIQDIGMSYDDVIGKLELQLPYFDLAISSISYIDDTNTTITINPSDYRYNRYTGLLEFLSPLVADNLLIFATTSAPESIESVKSAIKMIVTDLYELRTETAQGISLAENPAVKAMLYPFRMSLSV